MINAQFGYCTDDQRKLHKNPTFIHTAICDIHEPTNIMNPTLTVATKSDYLSCNYVYIPEWERYYYITSITAIAGNMMIISLREDVLMSFPEIDNLECALKKQEKYEGVATLYYNDTDMIPLQATITYTQPFSVTPSWDYNHLYLTTVG